MPNIGEATEFAPALDRLKSRFGEIDWQPELSLIDPHALGMVAVVVSNQQALGRANILPFFAQPIFRCVAADSGVDHEADTTRLHKIAVSVAARLEGYDFHGARLRGSEDWENKAVSGKIGATLAICSPLWRTITDARF